MIMRVKLVIMSKIAGASDRVPSFRASRNARPRSSVSRLMVEFAMPTMGFPPTKRTLFCRSAMYSRTRFGVTSMARRKPKNSLSRSSNDDTLPAALVRNLFDAPQGGIVSAPRGDGYVIAQVTGIAHPRPTGPNDAQFRGQAQQLAGSVAGDFSLAMANAQRAAQKVTVNQKQLDSTVGGGS